MNTVLSIARRSLRFVVLLGGVMAATGCASVTQPGPSRAVEPSAPLPQAGEGSDSLAVFPPPAAGQTRWVIHLSAQAREDRIKVELLPSIRMRTDCNHHLASAQVETHTVPGWGYAYQVMGDIGPVIATLIGCPAEATRERDVPVNTDLPLQRYNSRAPIVFYAPAQVTLRYRLWRGDAAIQGATPSN